MKDFLQRIENLPAKHLVLLALDQQKRLEKLESSLREAVAIVGIGCRFPGDVHGPDSFWELLARGGDAITDIPSDRWDVEGLYSADPEAPGRISTRRGGFLRDVDAFDAPFFGISRREAISMDPQQRLLLETSWEALEHAGVAARELAGSQTGLFFGMSSADYYQLLLRPGFEAIDTYTATGASHSIAAGRLAYLLGVHGPAMVLDTACSSSLVALHLACQSLRMGECDLALAGGVNLILSPEGMIALSKARMLAPDGRCKAFDAAADGFVRAEGCGVVALKLLSQAVHDRDNIQAVIRGSAVNQDGHSHGLTAPNGAAQEKLINRALEAAGVKPPEIQYVEAHGTGTSLGDPIEAHALAAVLGPGRDPQNPLYLGSVKTNIGHLEAAAGIAGIIKTALSLQRGIIPASLHFSRLNPHIDLKGAPLMVAAEPIAWPHGVRRMAGVSSFGFSGTNAHVIVEEPPPRNPAVEPTGDGHVLVLSARTATAMRTLAHRYAVHIAAHPGISLWDLCYTADTGRSRFEHVLALSGATIEELRGQLARVAEGHDVPGIEHPSSQPAGNKIALPTYPFEPLRYWVESGRAEPAPQPSVGFYKLEWDKQAIRPDAGSAADKRKAGAAKTGAPNEKKTAGGCVLRPGEIAGIAKSVAPAFNPLSREHGLDRYAELRPQLERLTFEQIARALEHCGWHPQPGDLVTTEELGARLGIPQRNLRVLGRMLDILEEEGMLERQGLSWRVVRVSENGDGPADYSLLKSSYPQFSDVLELLRRCSGELENVLLGRTNPLHLLFPAGAFDTAEAIYEKSGGARVFQTLVQQTIALATQALPSGRTIRILEVGGGTGGTASYVARVLPAERAEYVFTDISPLFLTRGADKFKKYPFFRFEVLDIERDPDAQGFAGQTFDIVIAANCLHATADLRVSLKHIAQLLAPEGLLVVLEATSPERWVDVTFGLTDGWWRFTDTGLRGRHPLLSGEGWQKLLAETGFGEISVLPSDPEPRQALLLARGPASRPEKPKWLVIGAAGGTAKQVADQLDRRGEPSILIPAGDPLPAGQTAWRGVVDLSSLDTPPAEDLTDEAWADVHRLGCDRIIALTRWLAEIGGRLWVVTRGAQCVGGEAMSSALASSPLWGLGRTIALEHPEVWGGLVDLDPSAAAEEQAGLLVEELLASAGEDQIALRGGARHVARLKHHRRAAQPLARFRPHGSYLITGGMGGLGLVVARWMAEQGAKRLILVGRSGITRQEQSDAVLEIEKLGASVRIVRADIADPEQASHLFSTLAAEEPPLKGVIHAAAALSRDKVREMSPETLAEILRPKVRGTWLLHRHTAALDLDFFCLFSSTSSVLGAGGLGHYAAANEFLNAFAQYRRSRGLPALAIDWGTWDEMRAVSAEDRREYQSLGLLPMASSQALAALGELLGSPESCVVAAAIDWRILRSVFEARRKRPLLEGIEGPPPFLAARDVAVDLSQWERMSAAERESRIAAVVWEEICRALRIDAAEPMQLDRGFFEMGMDSLVSVELKNRLELRLGRVLPAMMTFNFPSVRSLAGRLSEEFTPPQISASRNGSAGASSPGEDALDDDEVARLLAAKLQSLDDRKGLIHSR